MASVSRPPVLERTIRRHSACSGAAGARTLPKSCGMTVVLEITVLMVRATLTIGTKPSLQKTLKCVTTSLWTAVRALRDLSAHASPKCQRCGSASSDPTPWRIKMSSRRLWSSSRQEIANPWLSATTSLVGSMTGLVTSRTRNRMCSCATPWWPLTGRGMQVLVAEGTTTALASVWCLASFGSASPNTWRTRDARQRQVPRETTLVPATSPRTTSTMTPWTPATCSPVRQLPCWNRLMLPIGCGAAGEGQRRAQRRPSPRRTWMPGKSRTTLMMNLWFQVRLRANVKRTNRSIRSFQSAQIRPVSGTPTQLKRRRR
mmetsp:Transcript_11356/g.31689  ORF Transcript_11356/g.31689 Transcript_11356/m.31689 type:complete len:316 (+) Transcript_11356:519-1466(+)